MTKITENTIEKFSTFVIFQTAIGKVNVEVFVKDETVWLTQKAMGQLFAVESHTITYHLKEIYKAMNLTKKQLLEKLEQFQF